MYVKRVLEAGLLIKQRCLSKCGSERPWGWIGHPQLLCTGIRNGDSWDALVYVKRVLEAGLLIKRICLSSCSSLAVFFS